MSLSVFLFSSLIILSVLDIFIIGTKGSYISRTFKDIPLSLVKSCVATFEENNETQAYFDKPIFEERIIYYLNLNLKEEVESYNLSFFYYVKEDDSFIYDLSDEPQNVQLHFNCNFYKEFQISNYLTFEIKKIWG